MAGKAQDDGQTLPVKESNLFKQLLKFYESKQYKRGLKAADSILKKVPEHGETLAMKGLTLNCMEKKEEAYELVRRGLKANLRSHVCWHVYGLLYRSDRDYNEATKCYINALRMDKDNTQILRDLAQLQVQMRNTSGFVDTRQKLLQLKPSNRNNWITFAVAQHLNKSYDVAVSVIEAYEGTIDEVQASEEYEHSEMLLYKASILAEAGKLADALGVLDSAAAADRVRDKQGMREQRAELLLQIGGRGDEAAQAWRELLASNPDNTRYHEGIQKALGLVAGPEGWTDAQRMELSAMYAELQEKHPASLACKRMPLDFKVGDAFREAAESYVKRFLAKGIPSLFSDLKGLYDQPAKVATLQSLFDAFDQALTAGTPVPGLDASAEPAEDGSTPQVWVWIFLAQHHDRLKHTDRALEYVARAAAAAPNLVEAHSVRSKILKHAGDLEGAAAAAEAARRLDPADRYLNSSTAKALFRAGYIDAAERTAAMFTKNDNGQVVSLFDMQCMWYEIECGRAHVAAGNHGKALKNFMAVIGHFADFVEDQFDFHMYCVRKMTLRSYIDLIKLEDHIMSNPFYSRAAIGAITEYLALHDIPDTSAKDAEDEAALLAAMEPAERKRYKAKKRKEALRKAKEEEEEAAAAMAKEKAEKGKKGGATRERDPDPEGKKLAATADPLGEATKLVVSLKTNAADQMETHTAAFEVYLRKGRLLLALAAVKAARKIGGADHPDAFRLLVRLVDVVGKVPSQGTEGAPSEVVQAVMSEELRELLGGVELSSYVSSWVGQHGGGSSMRARAAAAEIRALMGAKAEAVKLLAEQPIPQSASHAECVAIHKLLLSPSLSDEAAAAAFKSAAAERFQWSAYFGGARREAVDIAALISAVKELKV